MTRTDTLFANSRILMADDAHTDRVLMRHICEEAGCTELEEAKDGFEALEKINAWKPDLVLLDMNMPKMSGIELCRRLREEDRTNDTVIMVQTSFDNHTLKAQAFDAGVTDFIAKPLDARELVARATAHLERRQLLRAMEQNFARIEEELREAIILQNLLLPSEATSAAIRTRHGIDIAHYFHPASELGGDYLMVRETGDNRVTLIMADISGHGITSALYAFALHTILEDQRLAAMNPSDALAYINMRMRPLFATGKFATLFYGVIDTSLRTLTYAAAASPAPVLFSGGKVKLLNTQGYLIGALDNATYLSRAYKLNPGDVLFLYSDALLENRNTAGAFMRESDLVAMLAERLDADAPRILRDVLTGFFSEHKSPLLDDLSMVVCKF